MAKWSSRERHDKTAVWDGETGYGRLTDLPGLSVIAERRSSSHCSDVTLTPSRAPVDSS